MNFLWRGTVNYRMMMLLKGPCAIVGIGGRDECGVVIGFGGQEISRAKKIVSFTAFGRVILPCRSDWLVFREGVPTRLKSALVGLLPGLKQLLKLARGRPFDLYTESTVKHIPVRRLQLAWETGRCCFQTLSRLTFSSAHIYRSRS